MFDGRFCSERQIALNIFQLLLEKALQLGSFISTCNYWKRRSNRLHGQMPSLNGHLYLVVLRIAWSMNSLIGGFRRSCAAMTFPFTLLEIEYIAARAFTVAWKGIATRAAEVNALKKCCRLLEMDGRIRNVVSRMLPPNMEHPFNTVSF